MLQTATSHRESWIYTSNKITAITTLAENSLGSNFNLKSITPDVLLWKIGFPFLKIYLPSLWSRFEANGFSSTAAMLGVLTVPTQSTKGLCRETYSKSDFSKVIDHK